MKALYGDQDEDIASHAAKIMSAKCWQAKHKSEINPPPGTPVQAEGAERASQDRRGRRHRPGFLTEC